MNMTNNKLKHIIQGCQQKDDKAWYKLYDKYRYPLYILCLRYCKKRMDAEDTLQDGFIDIFRYIGIFKFDARPFNCSVFFMLLRKIMLNRIFYNYRITKNKPLKLIDKLQDKYSEENTIMSHLIYTDVLRAIDEQPEHYSSVFRLRLKGWTVKEITQKTGLTKATIVTRIGRTRKILKKQFKSLCYGS